LTTTNKNEFTLDSVFDCETVQRTLYKEVVEPTIDDILNGYNGTVFTYGQSGSGKTYTMFGDDIWDDDKKGVIPRSM
jgi:kinesin family protein 5